MKDASLLIYIETTKHWAFYRCWREVRSSSVRASIKIEDIRKFDKNWAKRYSVLILSRIAKIFIADQNFDLQEHFHVWGTQMICWFLWTEIYYPARANVNRQMMRVCHFDEWDYTQIFMNSCEYHTPKFSCHSKCIP